MTHEDELRALLRRVRRRWAGVTVTVAVARAALGSAVVALAGVALDAVIAPSDVPLLVLAAATIVGACAVAAWMLTRLPRRPSDAQVARFIEEQRPGLEDRLASAAEVLQRGGTRTFDRLVLADAAARVGGARPELIVDPDAMRRAWIRLGAALALLGAALVVAQAPAGRAWRAARLHFVPEGFAIAVDPGDAHVLAGEPLRIRARLDGVARGYDGDPPVLVVTSEGRSQTWPMRRVGEAFDFTLPAVMGPFVYRVSAGRVSSRDFTVTALYQPHVTRIDVEYDYPAFTKLPPRREEDGGDIYAPAGTRVGLRVMVDKPVQSGSLTLGDGARLDLRVTGEREMQGALSVDKDGSYRVSLADSDGLTSLGDTEYFIRVMEDRPPDVRILRPAGDRKVTPLEEVAIEARAEDDYGIDRLELVYAVRGGRERAVPLVGGGSTTSRTGARLLFIEDLSVKPGDFITYYARARDVARGRQASEGRSDIYFLEVKPFDETFVAATSMAGAGRNGRSLENLITAQKDIISATWKLDRRRQGGQSVDDIKAVGRAQGQVKAQAEAAAGPARAFDRGRSAGGAGDPLAKAVDAMGRAQAELDTLRTSGAFPHEMEALNQLLRAEAEIRRREVSRQQQTGGGGSAGRQGQDLSALFDRELQRQQASNYETRAQNQPPDASEKDPLEEIRELAQRQNELSQQQRDLARAQLDPEELKRQLERLTREQNELRQRAEDLTQRLARQQAPSTAGTQGGQAGQAAGRQESAQRGGESRPSSASAEQRLREAASQMRGAAGDLRRQDLEAARQRSERAEAALRDLERTLRGARPDERQRALGDLQLEARQVADEQRRLANDSRRLADDPTSAQGDDAGRRVAAAKERLADRVDQLQQTTRQLAGGSTEGAAAEAARDLEREGVSRRLRDAASALRRPGSPERETLQARAVTAAADEQLARTLDRVAKKLGEATGSSPDAETRSLADRLARTLDLRERLADLERKADQVAREAAGAAPTRARGRQEATGADRGRGGPGDESAADRAAEVKRLQQEYADELRRARDLVDELRRTSAELGRGLTPETHEYSMGAPGTQAFKQDYSRWESLRRDVGLALERYEQALSAQLAERLSADRMNAGASLEMPEQYRALVARYYESLAKKKK